MKKTKMGRTCSTHVREEMGTKFWRGGILMERNNLEGLDLKELG
jgi:hypothetical protein